MIDITEFCWKIWPVDGRRDRLRLSLFCAPGCSGPLARLLKEFEPAKANKSAVIVRRPRHLVALMRHLTQDAPLLAWLEQYRRAWASGRMGRVVDPLLQHAREEAVEGVLKHLGLAQSLTE